MLNFVGRLFDKAGRIFIGFANIINNKRQPVSSENRIESASKLVFDAIGEIKPLSIKMDSVNPPKVVLLIPSLIASSFFGVVATALIVAAKMAVLNRRNLAVVQTGVSGYADENSLLEFYERSGIEIGNTNISVLDVAKRDWSGEGEQLLVNSLDLFIASAWYDAYLLDKLQLSNKFLYLIQDYEPIFYANSDRFVMAENTYHYSSYIPLCNTKLMYLTMLEKKYTNFSDSPYWFEPAVSNIKTGVVTLNEKRNMFLYGRPSVARNLFYSVVIALKDIFENNLLNPTEWNVFMAGQDDLPDIQLNDQCTIVNLGKMNVKDYINFSKSIDVAISLMMAPHPNYPTLEFASIGSAVVTTKYGVKENLASYSKNIFTADLTSKSIAENIVKAAEMPYEVRLANLASNKIESDWNVALDTVLKEVSQKLIRLTA